MTAKEYLKQALTIDQRINDKLEQVSRLRDMATKATSTISDMPGAASPAPHKMECVVTRLMDTENEIDEEIEKLVALKVDITKTIWKVEDINCRLVLEFRYLSFMSWEKIGESLNYTVRWVHKLHARGLTAVEKILATGH